MDDGSNDRLPRAINDGARDLTGCLRSHRSRHGHGCDE
jgi:hypothetical protein